MRKTASLAAWLAGLTAVLVVVLFRLEGRLDFSLYDEGFLWYGVQRVLAGEVPMRDFMAYDPGRYYFSAALMRLWGDCGLLSLRATGAVVEALGLFAGLWIVARSARRVGAVFLVLAAVTLVAWMQCYWIIYNITIAILLVAALAWLAAHPSGARHFGAGIMVGLAAVIGRNHGVYGLAGSLCALAFVNAHRGLNRALVGRLALWSLGVVIGFAPTLVLCAVVPGFYAAYLDNIRQLLAMSGTNITLPIPWPWTVPLAHLSPDMAVRKLLVSLFFLATGLFGVVSLAWLAVQGLRRRPLPPVFVGAACLGLPYAHYAFSRADIIHLAHGIFPLLLGCLGLLAGKRGAAKWLATLVLCGASVFVMMGEYRFVYSSPEKGWTEVTIGGDRIVVDAETARDVALLRGLADKYLGPGKELLTMPRWPGAYALLGQRSPVWEIYAIHSRPRAFEEQEIARLDPGRIGLVLLDNQALDGRDDLRFQNTHPLTYRFVREHFDRLPEGNDPRFELYVPKKPGENG